MSGEIETITGADLTARSTAHRRVDMSRFDGIPNAIVNVYKTRGSAGSSAVSMNHSYAPMRFVARTLKDGRHVVIANPEGI